MNDINAIVSAFEKAVSKGDVKAARETAQELAKLKPNISVSIITAGPQVPTDQWFRINVKLESATRNAPPTPVPVQVSSRMTVYALKVKMELLYSIHVDCQRWIIGKKIAKDKEMLGSLAEIKDQSKVFLYVLEPNAVSSLSSQSQVAQHRKELQKFREKLMRGGADPDLAMTEDEYNGYLQDMNASNSRATTPQHSDTNRFPGTQQPRGPPASNYSTFPRARPHPTTEYENTFRFVEWDGARGNEGAPLPGPNGDFMDGVLDTDGYLPHTQTSRMQRPQQLHVSQNRPAPTPRQRRASPPPPLPQVPLKPLAVDVGWSCKQCTFINPPTIPACRSCLDPRPEDYKVPPPNSYIMDEDEERLYMQLQQSEILLKELEEEERVKQQEEAEKNRQQMMQVASMNLVTNTEPFECPVCFTDVEPNEGVKLRECLHEICRDCLENHINISNEPEVKCPYTDGDNNCEQVIPDREIRQIISEGDYNRYLQRGLNSAEAAAADAFHCKSPDCVGLCFYDDEINFFDCEVCGHQNCLTCKAIHEGQNCKQYQEELKIKAGNDEAAKKTHEALQRMVQSGEAMHCPKCGIIIQKKSGCDWMQCSVCKVEICWVTKGPRWGPRGNGDTSGGCKCRVNGKCHPNCGNCH